MNFNYEQFDIRNHKPNAFEIELFRGLPVDRIIDLYNDNDEINLWICSTQFQTMLIISYIIGNKPEIKYMSPRYTKIHRCISHLNHDKFGVKFKCPKGSFRNKLYDANITDEKLEICRTWKKYKDFDHDLLEEIIRAILNVID